MSFTERQVLQIQSKTKDYFHLLNGANNEKFDVYIDEIVNYFLNLFEIRGYTATQDSIRTVIYREFIRINKIL